MTSITTDSIYTSGGTVQAGSGIYIPRNADDELLALCRASVFAYVLTARQMGKSSLMIRTAETLGTEGIRSATIDLTKIGASGLMTEEEWYFGLIAVIKSRLGLKVDLSDWWDNNSRVSMAQRLTDFLETVLLVEIKNPVVIFIDEIDTTLRLSFRDDFYAAIRYMYNERADNPKFRRLSFVLFGVATPSSLISNPDQTPFNIGRRVDLSDFTFQEAGPLADGLSLPPDEARQVLRWVLDWTGGHPYLTQRLCLAIVERNQNHWTKEEIDELVATTFFNEKSEEDHNLQFVRDMLIRRIPEPLEAVDVLLQYREIRKGKSKVADEERVLVKSHLKLSGIVCPIGGVLEVRNPIYKKVFDEKWVAEHLPATWTKRQLKRVRGIAAGLAAVLMVVTALAVYAASKALEAKQQRLRAEETLEEVVAQREIIESQLQEVSIQKKIADEQTELARSQLNEATLQRKKALEAAKKEAIERNNAVQAAKVAEEAKMEAYKQEVIANKERVVAVEAAEKARMQEIKALESAKRAEEAKKDADLSRQLAEDRGKTDRLYREGVEKYLSRDQQGAIGKFEEALKYYQENKDTEAEATTFFNLGLAYSDWNRGLFKDEYFQKAVYYYKLALPIYEHRGNLSGAASIYQNLALVYSRMGNRDDSISSYEQARQIYHKLSDYGKEAATLEALADIFSNPSRTERDASGSNDQIRQKELRAKALDMLSQAYVLYKEKVKAPLNQASVLSKMAELSRLQGDKLQAIKYYEESRLFYKSPKDAAKEEGVLLAIGRLYIEIGDKEKTTRYYEDVESEYKTKLQEIRQLKTKDELAEARVIEKLARFSGEMKETKKTLDYFDEALRIYKSSSNRDGIIRVLTSLAVLQTSLNEPVKAANLYLEAYRIYIDIPEAYKREISPASDVFSLRRRFESLYYDTASREIVEEHYNKLLASYRQAHDQTKEGLTLYSLGQFYAYANETLRAKSLYNQALSIFEKKENFNEQARVLEGLSYLQNDLDKKKDIFDQTLSAYQRGGNLSAEANTLIKIGGIYVIQKKSDKAIDCYTRALQIYLQIHDNLSAAYSAYLIGTTLDENNESQRALQYLIQSVDLYKSAGNTPSQRISLLALSRIYKAMGDQNKANELDKQAAALVQSAP